MILEKIAQSTRKRIEDKKKLVDLESLKKNLNSVTISDDFPFEKAISKPQMSFICEVKKASPSKGMISEKFDYLKIADDYEKADADAVSVLTEPDFFLGDDKFLKEISERISLPTLRKDFTVDSYQIYEAKLLGASAVLFICSLLDTSTLTEYIKIADSLGLSALVEAHDEREVESAVNAGARIIGVNNRNLKTFEVDIENSVKLRKHVPDGTFFVAESGISTRADIEILEQNRVDAVLIGETLMRSKDPKKALDRLRGYV